MSVLQQGLDIEEFWGGLGQEKHRGSSFPRSQGHEIKAHYPFGLFSTHLGGLGMLLHILISL
jgi:hypothetical protein